MKLRKRILLAGLTALMMSCAVRIEAPVKEARAVWYSRFEYCNATRNHDQDSIKQHISEVIHKAADANFNIIIFQIRGNGDAYYRSDIEPWGELLTGELGKDPGWDPLEYAIEQAHSRGLELHAWINTFPVWRGTTPPKETTPLSPYLAHPEWLVCDSTGTPQPLSSHYVSFSPGIPDVHDYLISLVLDIVKRYDVDGIHFDYIRYPEGSVNNGYSHDSISVKHFKDKETGNPFNLDWADWQREQLNHFVYNVYNAVHKEDPAIKMSTATIGSYDKGAWTAYHAVFQDGRRWAEMGKVDFLAPMIYWERTHPTQPFMKRSLEWRNNAYDRYTFPGLGSYRYNTDKKPHTWDETVGQIYDLREKGFNGLVFFDAGSLENHWEDLGWIEFASPANIPPMSWLDIPKPVTPYNIVIENIDENKVKVQWNSVSEPGYETRFNIFVSSNTLPDSLSSRQLRAVTLPGQNSIELELKREDMYLSVSALNKAWVESPLSEPVKIRE
jgi:uncharacterized lipoprotein YddW (UPF0748 family)